MCFIDLALDSIIFTGDLQKKHKKKTSSIFDRKKAIILDLSSSDPIAPP